MFWQHQLRRPSILRVGRQPVDQIPYFDRRNWGRAIRIHARHRCHAKQLGIEHAVDLMQPGNGAAGEPQQHENAAETQSDGQVDLLKE